MARFNIRRARPAVKSPVTTTGRTAATFEGGTGHLRDARSELFLLAVTTLGSDTFYETGGARDDRYTRLVRRLAVEDPEWTAGLLRWLRDDGQMRTAALVGAAEFVRARLEEGRAVAHGTGLPADRPRADGGGPHSNRSVIASVLRRPDEPGELLGYWMSRYGRAIPKPVKRGIADAVRRLYSERSLLKYDSPAREFRFGDVLELVHAAPSPELPWQGDLFRHAIDRRHGRGDDISERLPMLRARARLMAVPAGERRRILTRDRGLLERAGMTWEALAGWLQGPMDAEAWESIVPSMGYMALLRNLRNFDEAGVSDEVARQVAARLSDPGEVAGSRQFPFRFLAAYRHAPSLRWAYALEQALNHSLGSVPELPGRTLVLVDRSGSMFGGLSERTRLNRADSAAVFGAAVALRAQAADLVEFGTSSRAVPFRRGESVLRVLERFGSLGGTNTSEAVRRHYRGHDRVLIVTDEQHAYSPHGSPDRQVPGEVPMYTWNLAGYRTGHGPAGTGTRHTFGGLTDHAFRAVPLLEAGRNAAWPWAG
ncbi:TROVE domain-containing protein [Streptomyces chitinivorans]|uniref:TROVE domain-containing protein n=1 Tax=Streptomyces chitinivorans TaxID=1257027 RepID=A0ABW7HXU3_9ACTN|nr:TROVE domain-containing protein [Streptomyces chitinivorans]MDH2409763.1 TROVE domain-containing protein [Streptomyces chitinivorans]